jgi:carbamate kinase
MLTDVDAVYLDYNRSTARRLGNVSTKDISATDFPAGSMGPKVAAAIEFAEATGRSAAIGRLEDAADIVTGTKGTHIEAANT